MDYGAAAAAASQQIGGLSIFDDEANTSAVEAPPALLKRTRMSVAAAAGGCPAAKEGKGGKGCVGDSQAPAPTPAARNPPQKHEQGYSSYGSGGAGAGSMLAQAQKCNRTAKNDREQQRAQRISDVIDQLKVTLDKANFSSGSSSKLHVLVSCESYLRSLREKIRCYEMEAKLREAARGHRQPSPPSDKPPATVGAAGPRMDHKIGEWATGKSSNPACGRAGEEAAPAAAAASAGSSRSGETDRMDTGDDCSSSSSGSSAGVTATSRRRRLRSNKITDNNNTDDNKQPPPRPPPPLPYSVSSSSDDDDSGGDGGGDGGVLGIAGVAPRGRASTNSSSSSSSAAGSDGDAGSSDGGGGSTSAGTTDSGSQGFTTDATSRGFTTDSSFSGYTGSLGSGSADTGSADGGSEESEEGGTSGSRMRVVNYFDIFRLSNVPMAIADKDGALVDVNDAMRGFGRIPQDAVSTLTVRSLVAPESSQALQDAMSSMLAASSLPQDPLAPPQQVGAKPFLANAGIGNRPTLLTVSLVYDDNGEASAFHVALIPRSTGDDCVEGRRSSTEYEAEAPGVLVQKNAGQKGGVADGEGGDGEEPTVARKRSPGRTWDAGGQTKSQKRRAAAQV
eukprot:g9108.t1